MLILLLSWGHLFLNSKLDSVLPNQARGRSLMKKPLANVRKVYRCTKNRHLTALDASFSHQAPANVRCYFPRPTCQPNIRCLTENKKHISSQKLDAFAVENKFIMPRDEKVGHIYSPRGSLTACYIVRCTMYNLLCA